MTKFYNSRTRYPTRINNEKLKACQLWENLRCRVESEKFHAGAPTYKGVEVCEEWLDYQNFASWFEGQVEAGRYHEGWQLDKDILSGDKKIYSPETCVFIPKDLNCVLLDNKSRKGKYATGVIKFRKGYLAKIRKNVKTTQKQFPTEQEAFAYYKKHKEVYVKELVNSYKGLVDDRVYDYFMNWKVEDEFENREVGL